MTTTLRYIGDGPTTFADFRIGQIEPGTEFGVPNNQAEAYTRRADIEVVGTEPDETDAPEATEAAEEAQEAPEQAPATEETQSPAEAAEPAPEPVAEPVAETDPSVPATE